ncbi:MAG: EpsG family protein, partial [Bacteroidaceae bacterium]|nr:EpsG family protein [Bacteroidaceae bacterium]
MVILPLIPRIRFTAKSFIRLSVLCLALYLSVNVVMVPLISIVQGSLIASRYTAYIMGTGNFNGFVGNYLIYMLLPAAATYHMYLAKPRQQDWQELVIEKYFISSTFLTALITFNRFFEYFSVLAIAMFATYMMEFSLEKSRRILIAWCVGILVVFNMIKFFVIPAGQKPRYAMYYPYTTVFDNIPTSYRIDMHDAVTKVDYSEQRE